ncbi:hypothetical protein FHG87_013567 [Trinorchestia longiramus]|nr:hypothetical protein FHG87_013567 [Trinorchestia longiramus]
MGCQYYYHYHHHYYLLYYHLALGYHGMKVPLTLMDCLSSRRHLMEGTGEPLALQASVTSAPSTSLMSLLVMSSLMQGGTAQDTTMFQ